MSNPKYLPLPYAGRFEAEQANLPGAGLDWLSALRRSAADELAENGLPSRKVEAWKYTNLAPLAEADLRLAADADAQAEVAADTLPAIEGTYRVVFVNGHFRADLSDAAAPDGLRVAPLTRALESEADWLKDHLGAQAKPNGHAAVNANTAFMTDGCVLRFEAGAEVAVPVHLVFVAVGGSDMLAHHPRNLVVAGEGSRGMVIESHIGTDNSARYWSNPVCEISVGKDAELKHLKVQAESLAATHIAYSKATIEGGASYESFVMTVGAALSRNEIQVALVGEEARCRLNGAYLIRGSQHTDTTTFIDHAKPHCDSDEVYKGVLDDSAHGVFQGKILVARDAQQTNGNQMNRAVLLSDKAEMSTKPELEIYADDVKCSHGATTGELDDDALFYMRARGIPADQARQLLIRAFIGELLDDIEPAAVREHLEKLAERWLNGKA